MFTKSVGMFDRASRGILGVALLLGALFGWVSGVAAVVFAVAGAVFVLTAMVGVCPLYNLLGINTREA